MTADPTLAHLSDQRDVWDRKPLIRALYRKYHEQILRHCSSGLTVEIGAGCGNLRGTRSDVVSLDIVASAWVDIAADAQQLPFKDDSVDNLVMLDVLHHIPKPLTFLDEAGRVLKSGGRLVMLEPGISPISHLVYGLMHPEPVDMHADVFAEHALSKDDPFDSNQAIATLLFAKNAERLAARFPSLQLVACVWNAPFSYPLSGGFRPWQLLTQPLLGGLLKLENMLPQSLLALIAFRLFAVLEKS